MIRSKDGANDARLKCNQTEKPGLHRNTLSPTLLLHPLPQPGRTVNRTVNRIVNRMADRMKGRSLADEKSATDEIGGRHEMEADVHTSMTVAFPDFSGKRARRPGSEGVEWATRDSAGPG